MDKNMGPFFLGLFLLSSCGARSTPFSFGITTRAELVALKGEPVREENIPVENGKSLVYPKNERFQLENDKVVYSFRAPNAEESSLIYWKHKFRDCLTTEREVPSKDHTPSEIEYTCGEAGVTVIYEKNSSFVQRIVEHATK